MSDVPPPTPTYDPAAIEAKWQARWTERHTNEPELDRAARPFYNLMMFPYPSAEGLHVGNMFAFTGADIYGRFKRLHGYDVFEPIGFDAFGIHSENYALAVGTHPAKLIPQNIVTFRRQLRRFGGMFDWRHAPGVHDPPRHGVRRHLSGARARAPARGSTHGRRAAAPGECLPARDAGEGPRVPPRRRQDQDRRVPRLLRPQSGHG